MSVPAVILAAPGWRVLVWVREHDQAMLLPVVAWERRGELRLVRRTETYRTWLEPYVLDPDQMQVAPLDAESGSVLFVCLVPPGQEYDDGMREAAEEVARAQEEHEEREEREARRAAAS